MLIFLPFRLLDFHLVFLVSYWHSFVHLFVQLTLANFYCYARCLIKVFLKPFFCVWCYTRLSFLLVEFLTYMLYTMILFVTLLINKKLKFLYFSLFSLPSLLGLEYYRSIPLCSLSYSLTALPAPCWVIMGGGSLRPFPGKR